MTTGTRFKLFLLSSVDYSSARAGHNAYLDALFTTLKAGQRPGPGEQLLNADAVFYRETGRGDLFEVEAVSAINRARGASMIQVSDFSRNHPLERALGGLQLHNLNHELVYDNHACFLVITQLEMSLAEGENATDAINHLFKGRALFANLGLEEHMEAVFREASERVAEVLKRINPESTLSSRNLAFCSENTLPMLLCNRGLEQLTERFKNEERLSTVPHPHSIGTDYPGAFFHPGWNYTLACGFPYEVSVNLLQIMIRCQSFFFCLGYTKRYFAQEFSTTLGRKDTVDEAAVDHAETMRLAFYDLLSNFNSFKNKLFPKYYEEADRLLSRWHCDEDVGDIKEYIELNFQAKHRLHNARIERQNERQNRALAFIAVLQVVTLYGAFADGLTLRHESNLLFAVSSGAWLALLYAFLLLSRYLKAALALSALLLFGLGAALMFKLF